jgi:hypothetical protein
VARACSDRFSARRAQTSIACSLTSASGVCPPVFYARRAKMCVHWLTSLFTSCDVRCAQFDGEERMRQFEAFLRKVGGVQALCEFVCVVIELCDV